tara:strand:+ start:104 stop:685 length:582 start_codon:yes stop_codon:yes gene_type:complete
MVSEAVLKGTGAASAAAQTRPLLGATSESSCEEDGGMSSSMHGLVDVPPPTPVLFFDGHCNLCNFFVSVFLRLDRGSDPVRIKVASLQSQEARAMLNKRGAEPEQFLKPGQAKDETVVFIAANGKLHVRSAAILNAVSHVAPVWLWVLCMLALFVPTCVRDPVYKLVARNRLWLFGGTDTCRRATKEDKRHFL